MANWNESSPNLIKIFFPRNPFIHNKWVYIDATNPKPTFLPYLLKHIHTYIYTYSIPTHLCINMWIEISELLLVLATQRKLRGGTPISAGAVTKHWLWTGSKRVILGVRSGRWEQIDKMIYHVGVIDGWMNKWMNGWMSGGKSYQLQAAASDTVLSN